jgi:REP element-mobilizing transposase RayT
MSVFNNRRYNSLRLLGQDYNSTRSLYALSLATDQRRPVFGDIKLAKATLKSLLSDQTLSLLGLKAFCLMPDHLHLLTGVNDSKIALSSLIGRFESYTTQLYWKRSREIMEARQICLPSKDVERKSVKENGELIAALMDWRATLRPEVVHLKNWPNLKPEHFLRKRLWQKKFFDHVIRNQDDLENEVEYIVMNPVKEGFVQYPQFYPFTGIL